MDVDVTFIDTTQSTDPPEPVNVAVNVVLTVGDTDSDPDATGEMAPTP